MYDVSPVLDDALDAETRAWIERSRGELLDKGAAHLALLLPQLARRAGRAALAETRTIVSDAGRDVDASGWRVCDAAGLLLILTAQPDDDVLRDLYWHGDMEEKTIVLRSLALLPITPATIDLLGEVQRTNTGSHFEAACLDSNLVASALRHGGDASGFTQDDFHRLVLKLAFLDLPVARLFDGLEHATPELSTMLQDFAVEREAAGRPVWVDTWRFIGRAPAPGTAARLLGGLEHGDDPTRLAAVEGLEALARSDLAPFLRERLEREPREAIRARIEALLT